ncbi:MAG: ABC transporter permease [Victivallales bacterium]|nr:ABC transporter permease [Victivallales bacterium]
MSFLMIFKVALRAIWRNKVRSALTALGIIVGIAAVIAVIAIGQGASTQMQNSISGMGHNLVMVFPGSLSSGGARLGAGMSTTLTADDGARIAQELSHYVLAVSPMVNASAQVMYMSSNWATSVNGVGPDFTVVRKWDVGEGSFFTETDVKSGRRVVVIGQTVATNLFGTESPLGKTIRVRNMPFKVLGVMARKGSNAMGHDQDDLLIMPYTTVRRVLQNSIFNNVNMLMVSLRSLDDLKAAKAEIKSLLRMRHRLGKNKPDDFDVRDMTEVVDSVTSISRMMTILLGVVASISLVVGGIGIMNIMLVSVTERTREIGLRMAIGARPIDILVQFLLESIVLSCVGGLVGVAGGVAGALIVGNVQKWPILITESSVAVSFTFSALVGIFFGFYPAWRASRLNPIDCLRYE